MTTLESEQRAFNSRIYSALDEIRFIEINVNNIEQVSLLLNEFIKIQSMTNTSQKVDSIRVIKIDNFCKKILDFNAEY